jgi:hypothetical protein
MMHSNELIPVPATSPEPRADRIRHSERPDLPPRVRVEATSNPPIMIFRADV